MTYRFVLFALPGWFREEFGPEMTMVFVDSMRDARSQGGFAAAHLWFVTIADVLRLATRLHLDAARQDLSYALRTLRRSPAFTLAVISTLALGLGPTLVVANYVQRVVLAPLPFPDADRLVRLWNGNPEQRRQSQFPLSLPDFIDYQAGQKAFSAVAAHTGTSVAMIIGGTPRQVTGVLTTSELHQVLGVHPVIGRGLVPEDCAPGAPPVMLIGGTLWRNEFGSRSDIVGEVIQVDGRATTIVGVLLPDGYAFPQGTQNAWVPLTVDQQTPTVEATT